MVTVPQAIRTLLAPTLLWRLAIPLDLPVAGLSAEVDLPLGVESTWGPDGGVDWLTLDGERRYRIDVGGRTIGDCPLSAPDIRVVDGIDWISDGPVICRVIGDARLRVQRLGAPISTEDALLSALGEAFATRRTSSTPLPPPHGPVGGPVVLPVTGLELTMPNDALWRVAADGERDHDGLVRLVPALPEVQVVVRRHTLDELPSCSAMKRRLLAGGWTDTDTSKIEIFAVVARNRFAGFDSIAWCAERPGELLDVRVASLPKVAPVDLGRLFSALATSTAQRPPLPSILATRDAGEVFGVHTVGLAGVLVDVISVDDDIPAPSPHTLALELGLAWAMRDGLAVTGRARLGHDGGGLMWGASLEVGASVIVAPDLALVLSMGWHEHRDALIHNRALGLTFELRRGWFAHQGLRWSLRVAAINLASQVPEVLGAPLEIAWQAQLENGLTLGLGLRTADSEVRLRENDGLELGLRIGWGALWR